MKYLVIAQCPGDRAYYHGPFADYDTAHGWAEDNCGNWEIEVLEDPDLTTSE